MAASARFEGRTVLVAGGTGGLGRAVSLAFLEEGARVVVTYRRESEFEALRPAAVLHGNRLEGRPADVSTDASVRSLLEEVSRGHGGLDVLVNTVGGFTGGKALWDEDAGALEKMLDLNLRPGWALARAVLPLFRAQGRGVLVNVAARAALAPPAGLGAYAASKAAVVALFASLAADLDGTGVRVNTVLPSIIDTEANRRAMPKADFSKWPKPGEIAKVVLFLASDDAKLVHGAAIPV